MSGEQRLCQGLGLAIPKAAFATFATAVTVPAVTPKSPATLEGHL